jgi:hypothetical protein
MDQLEGASRQGRGNRPLFAWLAWVNRRIFGLNIRVHSKTVDGPDSLMELVFLMVILKIPIVYLCVVVYHAIKSEPEKGELHPVRVRVSPDDPLPGFDRIRPRSRRRPPRPHGGPARAYARTARASYARADRVERG